MLILVAGVIHGRFSLPMKGFIIFFCVTAAIIWVLRIMRKREIEAFMASDAKMLDGWQSKTEVEDQQIDPILLRAQAYAERTGAINVQLPTTPEKKPSYLLKQQAFSSNERQLLLKLQEGLGHGHVIYTNVPIEDFIANPPQTKAKVKFLLCRQADLSIVGAVSYEDDANILKLREVFASVERPLLEFKSSEPVTDNAIAGLMNLLNQDQVRCPKCDASMALRSAIKGKHAGKKVYVCNQFPDCRGVVRAPV